LALVSTDLKATPAELVERYAARWAIEVCFSEAKHPVGVGQARNRRRLAIERTVPFGLVCHSLLLVWYALDGHAAGDVAARRARSPWYRHKRTPSTLDMLVAFRRAMLTDYHHAHSAAHRHKTHRRATDLGPYRRVNTQRCETQDPRIQDQLSPGQSNGGCHYRVCAVRRPEGPHSLAPRVRRVGRGL
jgi:hypothetical protein